MVRIINESIEDDFDKMFDFGDDNARWYAEVNVSKKCIKGATLLSEREYEKYRDNISVIENWWWLRSPGYFKYGAEGVGYNGSVFLDYRVNLTIGSIRPALILELQSSNLEVGDKFDFGGHLFTIISNDLAICDDVIGKGCFREDEDAEDANVYEKSDVKKFVDNWFNEAYRNYEG